MNNYPVKVLPVNAAIVFLQPLLKKGRRSLTKRFENHDKKSVENAEIILSVMIRFLPLHSVQKNGCTVKTGRSLKFGKQ